MYENYSVPLGETHFPASLAVRRSRHELHALADASQRLGRGWGPKRGSMISMNHFPVEKCIGLYWYWYHCPVFCNVFRCEYLGSLKYGPMAG